jgi:hypothetical protein
MSAASPSSWLLSRDGCSFSTAVTGISQTPPARGCNRCSAAGHGSRISWPTVIAVRVTDAVQRRELRPPLVGAELLRRDQRQRVAGLDDVDLRLRDLAGVRARLLRARRRRSSSLAARLLGSGGGREAVVGDVLEEVDRDLLPDAVAAARPDRVGVPLEAGRQHHPVESRVRDGADDPDDRRLGARRRRRRHLLERGCSRPRPSRRRRRRRASARTRSGERVDAVPLRQRLPPRPRHGRPASGAALDRRRDCAAEGGDGQRRVRADVSVICCGFTRTPSPPRPAGRRRGCCRPSSRRG